MKPRIAVFLSFSGKGGVERMVIRVCNGFASSGYPVDLLPVKTEYLETASLHPDIRVRPFSTRHTWSTLPELVHYLKTVRPAALLAAKDRAGQVAVAAGQIAGVSTRIVIRVGTTVTPSFAHRSRLVREARLFAIRRFYPLASGIIAISRGVAEDLSAVTGIPETRIRVIPNPVITPTVLSDATLPCPHPWLSGPVRGNGRPVLVSAGRLTRQKDFPTLIRAFEIVNRKRSARLLILGTGSEELRLRTLIRDLDLEDRIQLTGHTVNPYPYMKAADLFVFSSVWEGFGNVLAEALALGTPCVSTDCPSGPSEILKGGQLGPLVPPGDPEALAAGIFNALDAPVPQKKRVSAGMTYTLEASTRSYLDMLIGPARPA